MEPRRPDKALGEMVEIQGITALNRALTTRSHYYVAAECVELLQSRFIAQQPTRRSTAVNSEEILKSAAVSKRNTMSVCRGNTDFRLPSILVDRFFKAKLLLSCGDGRCCPWCCGTVSLSFRDYERSAKQREARSETRGPFEPRSIE